VTPGNRTVEQASPTPGRLVLGTQRQPAGTAILGRLPFTGLLLGLVALLGAVLTSTGLGLRSFAR
jgi:hypothetical protein